MEQRRAIHERIEVDSHHMPLPEWQTGGQQNGTPADVRDLKQGKTGYPFPLRRGHEMCGPEG